MALFKILRGNSQNLVGTQNANNPEATTRLTKDGYAYFTPDDGKFYIDISEGQIPIIGSSAAEGANRICINSGGGLGEVLVLNCGTATTVTWGGGEPPVVMETLYFDCGDAGSVITPDTSIINLGDSKILEVTSQTIFYDCGNSKTK